MRRTLDNIRIEILAVRARRGESEALEELICICEPRLLYFVRRLTLSEEDAYDVMQQTWLRVLRKIRTLRDPRNVLPWLYRVARNCALNHGRCQANYNAALADDSERSSKEETSEYDRLANADAIHHGLQQLSLPHQEVLTLFFLEAWSVEQIAAVIETPPGTVKSRLHYAKAALRRALEERE